MSSFSVTHWLIFLVIVYCLIRVFYKGPKPVKFCKACGSTGAADHHTPGNGLIELVLWICFIVPGLIYSIWRISARTHKCAACGSKDLVPTNSPIATATRKQLGL